MTDLTAVSLFAGVGGFDLALQRAGVTVTAAVEINPKARAVLARQFPSTILFSDVQEVTGHELRTTGFIPERGIITGGFPCQDLSVAGRREGLAGARSGLFWEIVRLLDELAPRWVVLENVPGLLSSNDGRDMGTVVGALGDLGYGWAYRVLDAQHFGVPQRRRRVFIVAGRHLGAPDLTGPASVLLEPEGVRGDLAPSNSTGQDIAGTLGGGSGSRGWADDTDRMTFIATERERERERSFACSPSANTRPTW
jgi:DNA (cytosine-5)-methyltransferase 1